MTDPVGGTIRRRIEAACLRRLADQQYQRAALADSLGMYQAAARYEFVGDTMTEAALELDPDQCCDNTCTEEHGR